MLLEALDEAITVKFRIEHVLTRMISPSDDDDGASLRWTISKTFNSDLLSYRSNTCLEQMYDTPPGAQLEKPRHSGPGRDAGLCKQEWFGNVHLHETAVVILRRCKGCV
jgi:hypothetical protein